MADIRCSNCGNNNPDFLDVCQFCQSPLPHPDDALHIGEEPTKKDTGELEEILPSWLKEARQQSREEVDEDATLMSETRPKVQNETPDLLAGLASQADSDDDDVPDWLASINPVADKTLSGSSAKEDEPSDFFAQFREAEAKPAESEPEPSQDETPAWMGTEQPAFEADVPAFTSSNEPETDDNSWMNNLGSFDDTAQSPAEKEPEDLSWLHDLESTAQQADGTSDEQQGGGFDFPSSSSGEDLSWLNNLGGVPASGETPPSQPALSQEEDMSWLDNLGGTSAPAFDEPVSSQPSSGEDLSWLNNLGGTSVPEESAPSQPAPSSGEDLDWLNNLGGTPTFEEPAPSQLASSQEDMSWLDNLGGTSAPAFDEPVPSQSSSSGEDLSWLDNLGGASASEEPALSQPASSSEDMDWLSNLGEPSASEEPTPAQPASSQEDMSWLDNLGGTSVSQEPAPSQPASSGEDLDWLSNLGGTSAFEEAAPAQPAAEQEDMDWLNKLGGASTPAFEESINQQEPVPPTSKPFQTAPLNELLGDEAIKDTTPDWLKNAMEEEPSMPSLDDLAMDHSSGQSKTVEPQFDEIPASSQPEPASSQPAFDLPLDDSSSAASADLDSLFNVDMPDWLSNEPESAAVQTPQASTSTPSAASSDDSLAPVELPSWVQAMRPVASSIDEDDVTVSGKLDQITEQEGPLAGFRGVIPSAPIGSSLRPKAFSMKLQVSDEQQAGATLFEQILAGETATQPLKAGPLIAAQRVLRLALSGVFIIVLVLVLALGLKTMPIFGSNHLSDLVATVPDSSQVLVVIDYEPSYAGELEATGGPLFDQLAMSKHSTFNFISMSPNGSALVDRLITHANITTPDRTKYQLDTNYFNLGFLPGGSAGVLRFIENIEESTKFDAVVLMTDNAESGRVWVEQLEVAKVKHPEIAGKPLFVVSSAQSAPMLQPYESSGQADIVINGLHDAANYEYINNTRPGIARNYWDAFGIGLFMAIIAIILGSVWNVLAGIRERRALAEEG